MTNKKFIVLVVLLLITVFIWKVDFSKFDLANFISGSPEEGKIVYTYEPVIGGQLQARCMEIYIMNSNGTGKKRLTHNNFYDNMPKLSPDGKRIVFISARTKKQEAIAISSYQPIEGDTFGEYANQIYIINVNGKNEEQLTFTNGSSTHPSWLSDGKRILFETQGDEGKLGKYRWRIMDNDGKNVQDLDEYLGFHIPGTPYFSPDSSKILYTVASGTGSSRTSQIWIINRNGTGKRQLTHGECDGAPAWSPDGMKIAYSSRYMVNMGFAGPSPRFAIYVMDADGSNVRKLTDDGTGPCWSPDGEKIVFTKYWGNGILVMDADGGNKKWIAPKNICDLTRFRTGKIVDLYTRPHWQ